MGVSELEAGFLSGEARVGKIPEPLRHAPEHGGGKLHLPSLPDGKAFARLDRSNTRRVSIRHQGAPENYACGPAARRCGFHFRFCPLVAVARRREETRAGAVLIAAFSEVRYIFAEGFLGHAAEILARRIRVSPRFLVQRRGLRDVALCQRRTL